MKTSPSDVTRGGGMPLVIGTLGLLVVVAIICASPVLIAAAITSAALPQSAPSTTAIADIPAALLPHYQRAPACENLPWQIVAGIGWVETRHGSYGGAQLDEATGEVTPHIIGIALDGTRSAAIRAPAGGSPWHDDPTWDHAVGPMQFISTTWTQWGIDASGDRVVSPHNAYDAIATAGRYLCDGRARLDSIEAAIHRYNPSNRYVADVLAKAFAYGMIEGGDPVTGIPQPSDPNATGPVLAGDAGRVVAYALAQVGDPYVYGAEGPDTFDCSGLTMAAYRRVGVQLPHRADIQVRYGRLIDWRREPIQPGDLLFLRGGRPPHDYGHTGIAIDNHRWVHAPRPGDQVKIAALPHGRIQAVRRLLI